MNLLGQRWDFPFQFAANCRQLFRSSQAKRRQEVLTRDPTSTPSPGGADPGGGSVQVLSPAKEAAGAADPPTDTAAGTVIDCSDGGEAEAPNGAGLEVPAPSSGNTTTTETGPAH